MLFLGNTMPVGKCLCELPEGRRWGEALGVWLPAPWWFGELGAWRGKPGSSPQLLTAAAWGQAPHPQPQRPQGTRGGSCEDLHVPHRSMLFQWGNRGLKTKSPDVWYLDCTCACVCACGYVRVCAGMCRCVRVSYLNMASGALPRPTQSDPRNGPKSLPSDKWEREESQEVRSPQGDRHG